MMKSSLKNKIIAYFCLLVIVVVAFFEVFSIYYMMKYYYSSMAGIMHNQVRYNAQMYQTYMSDYDLQDVIIQGKDQFYRANASQVQILSNSGIVLFDSEAGPMVGKKLETKDVTDAADGKSGSYLENGESGVERSISVSYPLKNRETQVGIIRLSTSLKNVDTIIRDRIAIFLVFGVIVIVISIAVATLMSNSIIRPIKELTNVALKLADGQFDVRAKEKGGGEIGELARTLNFMSDSINKKEEIKNDFISSVSHELRTPLTSIRGWAITLQSEDITKKETINDGLKIIERESDRLSHLVEDLLDFSRFTSGRITLKKAEFNIVEIVKNIIKQLRPRSTEKKIDVIFNYDKEDIPVIADSDRIKQVVINILDNSLKFTPEEGFIITNIIEDEYEITVEVIDSGIGISEEEISLITEKFYKGSGSNSNTGLGLSISEEILELHGGRLEIASIEGEGTTIRIILPKGGSA